MAHRNSVGISALAPARLDGFFILLRVLLLWFPAVVYIPTAVQWCFTGCRLHLVFSVLSVEGAFFSVQGSFSVSHSVHPGSSNEDTAECHLQPPSGWF